MIALLTTSRKVEPLYTTERPTTRRLSLLLRQFGFGTVENLEELRHAMTHTAVHVRLGALDVVMQVVAEQLDARDGSSCHVGGAKVSWEEDCVRKTSMSVCHLLRIDGR